MNALQVMRKAIDTTATRVIMGAVLLVFMFWGVSGRRDLGNGIVATVNGVAITEVDRSGLLRRVLRQAGAGVSDEQAAAMAADVLQQLIKQEAMLQEAERLGIHVSAAEIRKEILAEDGFKGKDGKFDEKLFKQRLRNMNYTQGTYEETIRKGLMLQKLTELVANSVILSNEEGWTLYQKDQTRVSLAFVRIPTTAFLTDIQIADSERDAFVAANKDKIEASYKDNYDRFYNLPKRYQLRMILLRTDIEGADKEAVRAKAEQVRGLAAAGGDFSELAKRWSEDLTAASGGGLGERPMSQFDPAEITAADAAGVGSVTGVFETARGFEILQVEKVTDARVISLEEATPDIAVAMLKEERVPKLAADFATGLLADWSTNKVPPTEKLAARNLVVEMTETFSAAQPTIPTIGENAEISAALRTATVGTVLPKVYEIRGLSYVIAVHDRQEPTRAEYDGQATMVRAQLLRQRQQEFVTAWADEVVARADVVRAPAKSKDAQ